MITAARIKKGGVGLAVLLSLVPGFLGFAAYPSIAFAQTAPATPAAPAAQPGGSTVGSAAGGAAGGAAGCALGAVGLGVGGVGAASAIGAAGIAAPGFPTADIGLRTISAANLTVNTVNAANTTNQTTITCILNALAWTVAKMSIQSITRSTVNWINSGFQGSPAFVSDLRENLSYLADRVANDFFAHLNQELISQTGFNITSPFQDQVNQHLRDEFYRTTASYGINQFYTLNKTAKDPKAFLNGNFSQGGFTAFYSASQNPGNNPFDAYLLASGQLWKQIDTAAKAREAELGWSKGFLPWRGDCAKPATPGAPTPLTKTDNCLFSPVKTPGSVIESQLEGSLGTGIRQLELADSINEIVAALIGQMVNQVLGSNGLAGLSQPTPGGGTSYIDQAASAAQYGTITASLADGVVQQITANRSTVVNFQAAWQRIATAANGARAACPTRPEPVITLQLSATALAKAAAAIAETDKIILAVNTARATVSPNQASLITAATTEYTSFLSSSNYPTAEELSRIQIESADTSADRTATQSLYSRMVALQKSCTAVI